jgi:tryptophan-rich sensory protein
MEKMGRITRGVAPLLGYLGASYGAAAVGGAITARSLGPWYTGLRKSDLNPPNWVFGPVWTTLYTMMGVAAWLVWRSRESRERGASGREGAADGVGGSAGAAGVGGALVAWWVQLALNVGWSAVFFGLRAPGGALGVIAALWAAIAVCLRLSGRLSAAAAGLLAPYLAWTTFAAYLNLRVYQLNRDRE